MGRKAATRSRQCNGCPISALGSRSIVDEKGILLEAAREGDLTKAQRLLADPKVPIERHLIYRASQPDFNADFFEAIAVSLAKRRDVLWEMAHRLLECPPAHGRLASKTFQIDC